MVRELLEGVRGIGAQVNEIRALLEEQRQAAAAAEEARQREKEHEADLERQWRDLMGYTGERHEGAAGA